MGALNGWGCVARVLRFGGGASGRVPDVGREPIGVLARIVGGGRAVGCGGPRGPEGSGSGSGWFGVECAAGGQTKGMVFSKIGQWNGSDGRACALKIGGVRRSINADT